VPLARPASLAGHQGREGVDVIFVKQKGGERRRRDRPRHQCIAGLNEHRAQILGGRARTAQDFGHRDAE
jgi:hypothetical protein